MARRRGRASPQRRRRKQGLSVINTAEAAMLASAATQTLFNTNVLEFMIGNDKGMTAAGTNALSLRELFNPRQGGSITTSTGLKLSTGQSTMSVIQANLAQNWIEGSIKMVTIPLAFKLGKNLAKPAITKINAALRKAGVASTVRL